MPKGTDPIAMWRHHIFHFVESAIGIGELYGLSAATSVKHRHCPKTEQGEHGIARIGVP